MATDPDYTLVIRSNKTLISVFSVVFALGTVAFWALDEPNDWVAWGGTLLVSSLVLGIVLGYRSQALEPARLGSLAYPVSWRLGCIWLVLAGTVEFVLAYPKDVSFTVLNLSPLILFSTFVTTMAFTLGWLIRRLLSGFGELTLMEKLQLVAVILAASALIVALVRSDPAGLPESGKDQREPSSTMSTPVGPTGVP